ncbi:portal protein [Pantoea cypripedii]|uniref:portal protein n=1 Tax=Pantoea cypripedii TaxID=55209 RepID=UPI0020C80A5B|nr:portal protein [Pantoea cypripedii]
MDARAQQLIKNGDHLFSKKSSLLSLWQEIADNFYPERADFTITRSLGNEFADHLMTSYPVLARRELGDAFASMLRRDKWFNLSVEGNQPDHSSKVWLEAARDIQYRAMYSRGSQFVRATKEGDHDFAAFGQCAITVELNRDAAGLLYRCWHLRDIAWAENGNGEIDTIHRKWKPTARALQQLFRGKISPQVTANLDKDPYREIECRHIIVPHDDYAIGKSRAPFVSLYIDCENEFIMEETPVLNRMYCIPRWQTVSGSQYAYSPSTIVALPDARLIQSITRVLLEAGEKAVDPPLVANKSVFRDDFNLMSGGITWADIEGDQDIRNHIAEFTKSAQLPAGMNIREDVRNMIHQAFYLNSLTLPQTSGMTAYEVSQRVQEYIRQALPLFSPVEQNYNGELCDMTFSLLMQAGAFGSKYDIPPALQGQDVQFTFESPLQAAIGQEKQGQLQATAGMLQIAASVDPSVTADVDIRTAFRDAMDGYGVPAKWLRSEDDANQIIQQQAQQQQDAAAMQSVQGGAQTLQTVADAAKSFNEAAA